MARRDDDGLDAARGEPVKEQFDAAFDAPGFMKKVEDEEDDRSGRIDCPEFVQIRRVKAFVEKLGTTDLRRERSGEKTA